MLVALTGFMGCGKSTVGRLLADALGCPFIDLDEAVAKYAENTAVLALGGGTVTVPDAVGLLQENTLCIYLKASLETIQGRLEGQTQGRPLADDHLPQRLAEREPLYEKAAHITLDTDGISPEALVDEIIIDCL